MKCSLALLLIFTAGCAALGGHSPTTQPITASIAREPRWSDLDVHAHACLFSNEKFPKTDVQWRGDPHHCATPFTVKTAYYDADYNPVTTAEKPGRYGAIVEITTERGHLMRYYLSLYRFPGSVDWDYVRLPTTITFPQPFGIDNTVVAEQHENFSEFIKYQIQSAAEHSSQPAMILAGLHEAQPAGGAFVARDGFEALDEKWWTGLRRKLDLPNLPYLVHLPAGYSEHPETTYPLILFLHGSGEAGHGDEQLAKLQNTAMAKQTSLPGGDRFIMVLPQCPPDADWSPYDLERLMEQIDRQYRVDTDREYLTGLSLGGYGTWDTAIAFPERYAAIAPMSGAGDPNDVARIKDIPTWIFHGAKDPVVPVEEAHRMFDALQRIGGRVMLTIDPNAGHNAWNKPYRDPAFFAWLLQQRRGHPAQPATTLPPRPSPASTQEREKSRD